VSICAPMITSSPQMNCMKNSRSSGIRSMTLILPFFVVFFLGEFLIHSIVWSITSWSAWYASLYIFVNRSENLDISALRSECKERLDKEGINEKIVGEISDYAADSYKSGKYDEVEVEYATKKLLKR
jgi:hypothetical protein